MSAVSDSETDPGYRRWDCTGDAPELLAQATDDARAAIEDGKCIVVPTDTVYGIGADAFNGEAVQRLLDAKARGRDMPPPVLIGEPSLIRALATDIPDEARELVAKHWPGPLTVILKRQPSLRMDLGETEGTVALRVPDHELAREILRSTGPMAVSSANVSGQPAALTCDDAIDQLGAKVSVYLDGGRVGDEGQPASTIVDFTQADHGQILRRGALSLAVLQETLPDIEDLVDDEPVDDDQGEDGPTGDESTGDEPTGDEPTGDELVGVESGDDDPDVVEAEVVETVEDIKEQIEGADVAPDASSAGARAASDTPSAEAPAAAAAQPAGADWHEPTTDELRITHPDHDIDQPDLFEGDDSSGEAVATPDQRA